MSRPVSFGFISCLWLACGGKSGSMSPEAGVLDPTEAVYDPQHLLEVEIEMADADWDLLRFEHHDFLAAVGPGCQDSPAPNPYHFYASTVTIDGETFTNVGVRKKGFLGSVTPVRPSLKVSFTRYGSDQRYATLRQLTLNNNLQDNSQLNACMTYAIFRAAGVAAPRCNFARVAVNGQDLGIYSNVESLKKPLLRRWFGDDGGNLYEGVLSDFRAGWQDTFELKTNELKTNELKTDRTDLDSVGSALLLPDSEVMASLAQVIDLDQFLTFWAVESLVNHWDGYAGNLNNFFVYHDPTSGRFHFLPWGVDATFGIPNPFPPLDRPASVHAISAISRRVYNLPEGKAEYRDKLQHVLDLTWHEAALLAEVDRMEAMIHDHVYPEASVFQADVARVRSFIQRRRDEIQAELDGPPPGWSHSLRASPCVRRIGEASGTFDTTWDDPFPPPVPFGVGSGTMTVVLEGTTPTVSNLGFSAGPTDLSGARQGVMVAGIRNDTGAGVVLFLGIEPELYEAGEELPVDMYATFGVALKGPLALDMPLGGFLSGIVDLEQAGSASGEAVSGSFAVEIWGN